MLNKWPKISVSINYTKNQVTRIILSAEQKWKHRKISKKFSNKSMFHLFAL